MGRKQDLDAVFAKDLRDLLGDVFVLLGSSCGPSWTMVTRLPKRRNIWPNSRPM